MAMLVLNQKTEAILQDLKLPKDISNYSVGDFEAEIRGKSFQMSREQLQTMTQGLNSREDAKKAYARFTAAYLIWINKRVSNQEVQTGCQSIVSVSQKIAPASSNIEDKMIRDNKIEGKWIDGFKSLFELFPSIGGQEVSQLQIYFGAIYFQDTCQRGNTELSKQISPAWTSVASTLLTCVQTPISCQK